MSSFQGLLGQFQTNLAKNERKGFKFEHMKVHFPVGEITKLCKYLDEI